MCALTGPGAALSIPGSLATRRQEQQPLALREGTFLHPASECRTMTKLLAHTMTTSLDIFSVCLHGLSHSRLHFELGLLWSQLLMCFQVVWPFRPDLLRPKDFDIEGGQKKGGSNRVLWAVWPIWLFFFLGWGCRTRCFVLVLPSFFSPSYSTSACLILSHPTHATVLLITVLHIISH